ncbi:hypothetical protein [Sphingobium sp.]|uniref:hypothetical protein n=1 Tax=Sphingobium sp. TaxID=1912891 RepID=UPI0028BE5574|nr:hypothetical protein [Sphingobium sp.]
MQDLHRVVLGERLSFYLPTSIQRIRRILMERSEPEEHLAGATELTELGETPDGGPVGRARQGRFQSDRFVRALAQRKREPIFVAARLGVTRGQTALPDEAELILQHRSLQARATNVVDQQRIIGFIGIDHQRAPQRAAIHEMMPVAAVSSKTPSLDAANCAEVARYREQTIATSFSKTERSMLLDPDRPRTSSIMVAKAKPAAVAAPRRPYWRRWLSRFPETFAIVDWRT